MHRLSKGKEATIRESFLVHVWNRQLIKRDCLSTVDGRRIEVLHPGHENNDSGPDFCNAIITIDGGNPLKGDVELHISPREWQAHSHHKDPNFNGVILHVVMWDDGKEASLLQSGEMVPILALRPYLNGSLKELGCAMQLSLKPDEPCHKALERYGKARVFDVLCEAGEQRFYSKAKRFWIALATGEADQVLYEGLMTALGYAKNKKPFEKLAQLLPLRALKELATQGKLLEIQALMLGMARLLPSERPRTNDEPNLSAPDEIEIDRLEQAWNSSGIKGMMNISEWRFFRVRPENFPSRRIVAASYLIVGCGGELLENLLIPISQPSLSKAQKELEKSLLIKANGYWASHFDFGIEAGWCPTLIGQGRARDIIVNAVLPFSFAWADKASLPRLKDQSMKLYQNYPTLQENWITRYMEEQIFNDQKTRISSARCQQGLIHLYKTFCVEHKCHHCSLG